MFVVPFIYNQQPDKMLSFVWVMVIPQQGGRWSHYLCVYGHKVSPSVSLFLKAKSHYNGFHNLCWFKKKKSQTNWCKFWISTLNDDDVCWRVAHQLVRYKFSHLYFRLEFWSYLLTKLVQILVYKLSLT